MKQTNFKKSEVARKDAYIPALWSFDALLNDGNGICASISNMDKSTDEDASTSEVIPLSDYEVCIEKYVNSFIWLILC